MRMLGLLLAAVLPAAAQINTESANRFLQQASWGPDAASVARVQQLGLAGWLDEQFSIPASAMPDPPTGASGLGPLQQRFFHNAVHGSDQLRQRVAFALGQIWVVSGVKIGKPEAYAPYLRLLSADAFGNYLDLMHDVTISPAMGRYLDMVNNDKPNPAAGKSADENYARELLQLFTIGEAQLNPDGTSQQAPAYTEETVQNLARVFTGWTYAPLDGATPRAHNPVNWAAPMVAWQGAHDTGRKVLLNGVTLPAGQTAEADLAAALENIFQHPNVGPFVSRQLIQHLVASNPSREYVARVAAVFADNGRGVRGDLKAVVRAILLDPEARSGDSSFSPGHNEGHLREPVLFMTALLRAFHATVQETNSLPGYANSMGQNLFYPASVFNYYSPGYRVPGAALFGPEFQIYTASTAIFRANFVYSLLFGRVGAGTDVDLTSFISAASDENSLLDAVDAALMNGKMSSQERYAIFTALGAASNDKLKAQTALYLTAASNWYQVQY